MKCKICYKNFECGIDLNSHNLFVHNIITNEVNIINDNIKLRLKSKYVKACLRLHIISQEVNKKSKLYHKSKRDRTMWNNYQLIDKKWQKQCYKINTIVNEIESYGLSENDFN